VQRGERSKAQTTKNIQRKEEEENDGDINPTTHTSIITFLDLYEQHGPLYHS
jgi:hypothetical protein